MVDKNTGRVVAGKVRSADGFFARFRGLMLRRKLGDGDAMLFKFPKLGRHSIHMFFVRFPIDLVYLDDDWKVVEVRTEIKPWRFHRTRVGSKYLIEMPAGSISRLKIDLGHKIAET